MKESAQLEPLVGVCKCDDGEVSTSTRRNLRMKPDKESKATKSVPLFSLRSTRLWICFLLTFGLSCTVSMRLDLSMAIVCMVNSTAVHQKQHHLEMWTNSTPAAVDDGCPSYDNDDSAAQSAGYNGHLEWTPSMQALLLSTTYYGGLLTIMFSGYFADKFGPKRILAGATSIYVVVTLLTPLLVQWSYISFFIGRVMMGMAEGCIFPSIASVTGHWFSPHEKSTIASFYTSGNQIASSLTSVISANLCASSLGWPAIFYLFGCLGIVWIAAWLLIFSNSPKTNRWISEQEKDYLGVVIQHQGHTKEKIPIQWSNMATSLPLIAAVLCQFAYNFQAATFQAFLPTYFKEELKVPLQKNGIYTTIPFIAQLVTKITISIVADHLKRKKILSHNTCAKIFQTISSVGCAVSMLGLATLPNCNRVWIAGILLAAFGSSSSCGIPGFFTSLLSLDPKSSGLITSIGMTFGMVGNISGPLILSVLNKVAEERKWYILFMICGLLNIVTGIIFFCCGSAEAQHWSRAKRSVAAMTDAEAAPCPEKSSSSLPPPSYSSSPKK